MSSKLIFAGAASLFSLEKIRSSFSEKGFDVSFCDASFMKGFVSQKDAPLIDFSDNLEPDSESFVVPLTENWISWCIKKGNCRVSDKALKASRSKTFFYQILRESGHKVPDLFDTYEDAVSHLDRDSYIVVKPDGLFSGYGVEIIPLKEKEKVSFYMEKASEIKNHAMRIMNVSTSRAILSAFTEGTEFSCDSFVNKGEKKLLRLCRKKVVLINDKPCTQIVSFLSPSLPEYKFFEKEIFSWLQCLFSEDDISFAQFDFKFLPEGILVPIDFAARIGGGMKELFQTASKDFYSDVLFGSKNEEKTDSYTMYNYLPAFKGTIVRDDFPLVSGEKFVFKKKGDHVISNPSSHASRIACVVQKGLPDEKKIQKLSRNLMLGSPWII